MARQRRSGRDRSSRTSQSSGSFGGFGSFRPEIRGTLGTLLRTTLAQAGAVRDVLERSAREGRHRLDDALASRRRTDALADLGEVILDLIRRGEIDIAELPEVRDIVAHLDELDDDSHPVEHDEPIAAAPARKRFDSRSRDESDDGTVSSSRWSSTKKPAQPAARVWRPPAEPSEPARTEKPTLRERPPFDKNRKGGISFDDEDLAEYMHPDDVPPKGSSDGDS